MIHNVLGFVEVLLHQRSDLTTFPAWKLNETFFLVAEILRITFSTSLAMLTAPKNT